jgi:hypothetical protein
LAPWLLLFCLGLAAAGSCRPARAPDATDGDGGGGGGGGAPEAAEDRHVDVPRALALVKKGLDALDDDKDFEKARGYFDRAEPFANESVREEIRAARQRVDTAETDVIAPEIEELAKSGKCSEAVDKTAAVVVARRGSFIPGILRKRTSPLLLACLGAQIDIDLSVGRELVDNEKIQRALEPASYQALRDKVKDATVGVVLDALKEPIEKRRWAEAVKRIGEMVQRGEATEKELAKVMSVVRQGVAEDVDKKVKESFGQALGAEGALREVDALIKAAAWGRGLDDSVREAPMPEAVGRLRSQLAFWVACTRVRCRLLAEPVQVWTYGKVFLRSVLDPRGELVATVGHAAKVWKLADGTGYAVVKRDRPGANVGVEAFLAEGTGWAKTEGLRPTDTAEWLPPGDAIVGARVWGPLRDGERTHELGNVVDAQGEALQVSRLADLKVVTARRSQVRFGSVPKGMKVLALCQHAAKLTAAVVDAVMEEVKGDPVAELSCLDDQGRPTELKRKVQLGALRANVAALPPRR